jgi:hypothetical protein
VSLTCVDTSAILKNSVSFYCNCSGNLASTRKGETVGSSFRQVGPPIRHEFRLRLLCLWNTLYHGCSTCALSHTHRVFKLPPPLCKKPAHINRGHVHYLTRKKKFEVRDLKFSQRWLWELSHFFVILTPCILVEIYGNFWRIKSWNVGITFLRNVGMFMSPSMASHSTRRLSYFGGYMTSEYFFCSELITVVDLVIGIWRDLNTGRFFYASVRLCRLLWRHITWDGSLILEVTWLANIFLLRIDDRRWFGHINITRFKYRAFFIRRYVYAVFYGVTFHDTTLLFTRSHD